VKKRFPGSLYRFREKTMAAPGLRPVTVRWKGRGISTVPEYPVSIFYNQPQGLLRRQYILQQNGDSMKNTVYLILCIIVFAVILSAGCTQNAPAPASVPAATMAPITPPVSADTVKTASTPLGTVLTDAKGMTLYFFADDIAGNGKSTCYGGCAKFWPIFTTASPVVSPPLVASDFTVITRTDGTKQTSYKGWPLYYFSKDVNAGDTKGENIQKNWSVAKPDYSVMYAHQPAVGTYLTDGSGRTLYFLATENPGEVACTGTCLTNWPAFSSGSLVAPSLLKAADFSGTVRPDGARQSLYMGRLLYYFVKDTKPGDVNGEGVLKVWHVANITGYVPPVPAPVATTIPTTIPTIDYGSSGDSSGGGGGY
jgi:predicted lipoprotein with Yx(FWY)xxD motif